MSAGTGTTQLRHPLAVTNQVVAFHDPGKAPHNESFEAVARYTVTTSIARGTYGFVAEAIDNEEAPDEDGEPKKVAIKKVGHLYDTQRHWVCTSRELAMMLYFNHPNVMSARDMFIPLGRNITWQSIELRKKSFQEVYIVMDLMDQTLRDFMSSQDIVEKDGVKYFPCQHDHRQWFFFVLLCSVDYLHQSGVMHRDLKPENCLIDYQWNLKVCDFGQSRGVARVDSVTTITGGVCSQWYAAPECLTLSAEECKPNTLQNDVFHSADLWSVGCIAAEMLIGQPLFGATSFGGRSQLLMILQIMGQPTPEDVQSVGHTPEGVREVTEFLRTHVAPGSLGENQLRKVLHSPLGEDEESPEEVDLIMKMLRYNPRERITAQEALKHPFFEGFEPPEFEAKKFSFKRKAELVDEAAAREHIWGLFTRRHPEVLQLLELLKPSEPAESPATNPEASEKET